MGSLRRRRQVLATLLLRPTWSTNAYLKNSETTKLPRYTQTCNIPHASPSQLPQHRLRTGRPQEATQRPPAVRPGPRGPALVENDIAWAVAERRLRTKEVTWPVAARPVPRGDHAVAA